MNNVILGGNLVGDPDYKVSQDRGVPSVRFRIAVDKRSKGSKETIFLDCVAFRDTADFIHKHFSKGDGICVTGEINVRDWQDRNGVKRTQYEVVVNHSEFPVSGRSRGGGERVAVDSIPRCPVDPDPTNGEISPFAPCDEEDPSLSIKEDLSIIDELLALDPAAMVTAPVDENDGGFNPF